MTKPGMSRNFSALMRHFGSLASEAPMPFDQKTPLAQTIFPLLRTGVRDVNLQHSLREAIHAGDLDPDFILNRLIARSAPMYSRANTTVCDAWVALVCLCAPDFCSGEPGSQRYHWSATVSHAWLANTLDDDAMVRVSRAHPWIWSVAMRDLVFESSPSFMQRFPKMVALHPWSADLAYSGYRLRISPIEAHAQAWEMLMKHDAVWCARLEVTMHAFRSMGMTEETDTLPVLLEQAMQELSIQPLPMVDFVL